MSTRRIQLEHLVPIVRSNFIRISSSRSNEDVRSILESEDLTQPEAANEDDWTDHVRDDLHEFPGQFSMLKD
jgi:hypothetical protein